jgi:hypothetical protein
MSNQSLTQSKMAENTTQFNKVISTPLNSQNIRSLLAFLEYPWLNGIALFKGTLQET